MTLGCCQVVALKVFKFFSCLCKQISAKMKGPPEDANPPSPATNRLRDVDFSDYMWMGEEMEEFDKKVMHEQLVCLKL